MSTTTGAGVQGVQITIIGAGAVGLVIGTRLASCGVDVQFVTRRPETAQAIESGGVRLDDPATDGSIVAPARAVCGLVRAASSLAACPVLLCTRATETERLAVALARVAPGARVISAQNDIDNETLLAEHFRQVGGMVVRQTCTRTAENAALATGSGRLIVGRHPTGMDDTLLALADACRKAGFDVGLSDRISEDKWLKLVVNLTSAANALVRRPDHVQPAFGILKIRLLEEARDVLAAAGVVARSSDGRDRSIQEEIERLRGSAHAGTGGRDLPLYNACWAALHDPSKGLEADRYHARILDLATAHRVAAPTHTIVHAALLRARLEGLGPESSSATELLRDAEALE